MSESKSRKRKPGGGRKSKLAGEKLVSVGGRISPEMLASIADIAAERDWSISTALRVACRLLINHEAAKKTVAVNESLLTS